MAKDLKQAAAECLAYNQTLNEVFVSADGECFPHKNDAINHARSLQDKEIMKFERDGGDQEAETTSAEKKYALNVADTVKLILETVSEEQLDVLIEDEERKTVLAASDKQRAILKQKALDEQSAQADEALNARRQELPKDEPGTEGLGDGVPAETIKAEGDTPAEDKDATAEKAEDTKPAVVKEVIPAKAKAPAKPKAPAKAKAPTKAKAPAKPKEA
jgi:hypothetical protein